MELAIKEHATEHYWKTHILDFVEDNPYKVLDFLKDDRLVALNGRFLTFSTRSVSYER